MIIYKKKDYISFNDFLDYLTQLEQWLNQLRESKEALSIDDREQIMENLEIILYNLDSIAVRSTAYYRTYNPRISALIYCIRKELGVSSCENIKVLL